VDVQHLQGILHFDQFKFYQWLDGFLNLVKIRYHQENLAHLNYALLSLALYIQFFEEFHLSKYLLLQFSMSCLQNALQQRHHRLDLCLNLNEYLLQMLIPNFLSLVFLQLPQFSFIYQVQRSLQNVP
jgi:hypothetical protein